MTEPAKARAIALNHIALEVADIQIQSQSEHSSSPPVEHDSPEHR
jgi:hypothetical protein